MSVHTKLMQARLRLAGTKLEKTGHNKFAGYYYFELGDFLPTAQAIFAELGLCGVVSFTADIATLTITDTETGGEIVITSPMGSAALKGCHEVQNVGAVETYQRRYLWVSAFEIVEHDALGATTGKERPKPEAAPTAAVARIGPTAGLWEALDAEQQAFLQKIADAVLDIMPDADAAHAYLAAQQLDTDEKAALWTRLDSKTRSALKKAHKEAA